jgi:hypothetical protein
MPAPGQSFLALTRRCALMAPLLLLSPGLAAQAPEPDAPADPATAPPQPPDLTQPPLPAQRLTQPAITLPPSMENLPGGGWRINGPGARGQPDIATLNSLTEIGRWLAGGTTGRVTLLAQVAGPMDDISTARRASLSNAQTLSRLLQSAGLDGTRIDLRPLGRTAEARDAVELLPPSAPRSASATPVAPTAPAPGTPSQSQPRP